MKEPGTSYQNARGSEFGAPKNKKRVGIAAALVAGLFGIWHATSDEEPSQQKAAVLHPDVSETKEQTSKVRPDIEADIESDQGDANHGLIIPMNLPPLKGEIHSSLHEPSEIEVAQVKKLLEQIRQLQPEIDYHLLPDADLYQAEIDVLKESTRKIKGDDRIMRIADRLQAKLPNHGFKDLGSGYYAIRMKSTVDATQFKLQGLGKYNLRNAVNIHANQDGTFSVRGSDIGIFGSHRGNVPETSVASIENVDYVVEHYVMLDAVHEKFLQSNPEGDLEMFKSYLKLCDLEYLEMML